MICRVIFLFSQYNPSFGNPAKYNERTRRQNIIFIKRSEPIFSIPYMPKDSVWDDWSEFHLVGPISLVGLFGRPLSKTEKSDFMIYLGSWRLAISTGCFCWPIKGAEGQSRGEWVPGVVYLGCASVGMRAEDGFQGAWTPARASNTRLSHVRERSDRRMSSCRHTPPGRG